MKTKLISALLAVGVFMPVAAFASTNLPPLGYVPPVVKCTLTATPNTGNAAVGSTVTLNWTTTNAATLSSIGFNTTPLNGSQVVTLKQFLNMYFITAIGKYNLGVAICNVNVKTALPKPVL